MYDNEEEGDEMYDIYPEVLSMRSGVESRTFLPPPREIDRTAYAEAGPDLSSDDERGFTR